MPVVWLDGKPKVILNRRKMTTAELRQALGLPADAPLYRVMDPHPAQLLAFDPDEKLTLTWLPNLATKP